MSLLAVLDIGKTNARLALLKAENGEEVWSIQRANGQGRQGVFRELDVAGLEAWLLEGLAGLPMKEEIRTIVPVAHGAGLALLAADGTLLAAPDYEDPVFDEVAKAYRDIRDPFAVTLSPDLPLGLNLGRQLFFMQTRLPELFARAATCLTWAQYWTFRLSGVRAIEPTSLGAHSDLWDPRHRRLAPIVARQGWARLMPPLISATEPAGRLRPELAARTGLPADIQVMGGIHDSNASYWRHRAVRPADERFAVVSTGTWIIALCAGADLGRLQEARDMLANVDASGRPTAATRFMGGREYAAVAGADGLEAKPDAAALERLVAAGIMALPSFSPTGGPFAGCKGRIVGAQDLSPVERATLATLYTALLTDVDLDLLDQEGEIVLEGLFAQNPLFASILATLRPKDRVSRSPDKAGTLGGAWLLATGVTDHAPRLEPASPLAMPGLVAYRALWRTRAEAASQG
ncbi:Sugar (pentulose or hexulose) kinase [Arboricoccus pini]|uniref:Sugar (Pentulose or hexulose) kinase n=1 Tax=Arboricoccus pini TaxID=1963835 RepID=A0A212RXJ1_9PROT|nr:FGGY family carbohydrate kinase [Arboricoccus pini]SNB77366.1 Sugar (pentulose or hexulose) kinase [Arboricoccus pini]